MGSTYAGILGTLAFAACVARALIHGGETAGSIYGAVVHLVVFAIVGYVVGRLAESIIDDSLRGQNTTSKTGP